MNKKRKFVIPLIYSVLISLSLLITNSCQTEIEVTPPDYYNKIVVEGYIEIGKEPIVSIHRSVPYFSDINFSTLMNDVFIDDAVVTVTSEFGESEVLTLQQSEDAPLFFAYKGSQLKGQPNTTYHLKIELDGKVYTSETRILEPFALDSLFFVEINELYNDSTANIRFAITDNPAQTNYYQFRVKVRNRLFQDRMWVNTLPAVFDDIVISGTTFEYDLIRATPSMLFTNFEDEETINAYNSLAYHVGDTVLVNYSQIDYNAYRFWNTANSDMMMGQNPFTNPIPIQSNIHCDSGEEALGVWCGYAGTTDTLIFSEPWR